jgi:hypothetical protein
VAPGSFLLPLHLHLAIAGPANALSFNDELLPVKLNPHKCDLAIIPLALYHCGVLIYAQNEFPRQWVTIWIVADGTGDHPETHLRGNVGAVFNQVHYFVLEWHVLPNLFLFLFAWPHHHQLAAGYQP